MPNVEHRMHWPYDEPPTGRVVFWRAGRPVRWQREYVPATTLGGGKQGAVELLGEATSALRDLLGWIPADQPEHRRVGALITRIEQGGG